MPKRVVSLSDLQLRNAKKREKPYKLADGGGLYMEVTSAGSRLWRVKYRRPNGKENKLHLGSYPEVSLTQAREQRDAARRLLAAGVDPATARDEKARHSERIAQNTFEKVARDWHRLNQNKWQPQTAENILHRFTIDLFPAFGSLPIAEVSVPDVLVW